jgi:hypothetical protein
MSKSNKHGYVGVTIPTQEFNSNKGTFEPSEIDELVANDNWTSYGQMDLIETKTFSAVNHVAFTDMQVDKYHVHFVTYKFTSGSHDVGIFATFGVNNGDGTYTYRDSSNKYAQQYGEADGTFSPYTSTGMWAMQLANLGSMQAAEYSFNGYVYLYNLGDASKSSFNTNHGVYISRTDLDAAINYGGGVYETAERHEAFKMAPNTGNTTGYASLYGIRFS